MYESVKGFHFNLMWSGEFQLLAKPLSTSYVMITGIVRQ